MSDCFDHASDAGAYPLGMHSTNKMSLSESEVRIVGTETGRVYDIHTTNASKMFGIPCEQVTEDMRKLAKNKYYFEMYGGEPNGRS